MSKILRTAAVVVGTIALVVGTAGALAPAATAGFLGSLGIGATAGSLAAIASATAGCPCTATYLIALSA